MSGFSSRWRALAAAAREQPGESAAADQQGRLRELARRGLALRAQEADAAHTSDWGEWRSLALAAGLLFATGLGLRWGELPEAMSAGTLARDLAELPRRVPRAPRLPSPSALLAELDQFAALPWHDAAAAPGDHPNDPETRP